MGPGSSPGAGKLLYYTFKWVSVFFIIFDVLSKFTQIILTSNGLNYSCNLIVNLGILYSSWILHILFIYLVALIAFKAVISITVGGSKSLR